MEPENASMMHHYHRPQATLQHLPLEMLEMVLMKTTLELIRVAWEETAYRVSVDMFSHLATVWSEWYYRITTRWFRLVLKRNLQKLDPSAKYLRNPKKLDSMQLSVPIWGLAIVDNELFVVSIRLPAMMVFDTTSLKRCRCHEIDELRRPRDIVSLPQDRRLYIAEGGGCPYWIHCVNQKGETLTKWDVKSDPRNLSVAGADKVLVTCNESIKVYSKDGVAIRDVRLDTDWPVAWQALYLSTGNYVICLGFQNVTPYHAVSLLRGDGTLSKRFGGARGSGIDQLSNPFHLGIDRDQCLLVVDSGNRRVRLFTPRLVHVRDLLTEDMVVGGNTGNEDVSLNRHALDGKSGRLYVATNTGSVIAYRVFGDMEMST